MFLYRDRVFLPGPISCRFGRGFLVRACLGLVRAVAGRILCKASDSTKKNKEKKRRREETKENTKPKKRKCRPKRKPSGGRIFHCVNNRRFHSAGV